jgi:hypothetical protein
MANRAGSGRAAYWRELIERRSQSGLSIARFCEQAGVSTASFYQWQSKLRGLKPPTRVASHTQRADSTLVPVRIVHDSATSRGGGLLEIELPGEIRLRIPSGCDPATLHVVLTTLLNASGRESASC